MNKEQFSLTNGQQDIHIQMKGTGSSILHHTQKVTRRGSDLNLRPELKKLAEYIRVKLHDTVLGSDLLGCDT